jgi:hypothetical protein
LAQKIECGPASHRTAFVRGFLLCLITAWRRNDRFSPTALERSAAFAKASCRFMISRPKDLAIQRPRDHESATAAVASGPALLACSKEQSQDGGGGRNAQGNPSRLRAFLDRPPAIHPRESPAAAGSAAIIRQAQETSRFAEPTLSQFVAPRNTKTLPPCAETVDDETSLWKTEEN